MRVVFSSVLLLVASLLCRPVLAQYHGNEPTPCTQARMVTVSDARVDTTGSTFIQSFATLRPTFHLNAKNQALIGFDHNCVTQGSCSAYSSGYITESQADSLFDSDLQTAESTAAAAFPSAYLSQNQYNVLIDLVYATGKVPAPVASLLTSAGSEPVSHPAFDKAVKQACEPSSSGISATRCKAEVKLAQQCQPHSKGFPYRQTGGEFCSAKGAVGLCLDDNVYSCPGGQFTPKAGQCGTHLSCCLVPIAKKGGTAANTILTLEAMGNARHGLPASYSTVYPRSFCTTTGTPC